MENKLKLNHLCAYLPYGLQMATKDKSGQVWILGTENIQHAITWWKPVLRPMSDLYNCMPETENSYYGEAKKETGFDLDSDFSFDIDIEYSGTRRFSLLPILSAINFLLKHHFDIFGLIDGGLAIDINTLQK